MNRADDDPVGSRSGVGAPGHAPRNAPHRFVLLVDRDGRRHAVARQAVSAMVEGNDGTATLLLPGGRLMVMEGVIE